MGALISLIAVAGLAIVAMIAVGVGDLRFLIGVVFPGVAFAVFLGGIVYRVIQWGRSTVPFRIPTTCAQEKSLPWIKNNELDNPSNGFWAACRVVAEVLFFRSLFRNHTVEVNPDKQKVSYIASKYLWAAAMAFHWTMLIIVLRHFRFFVEPVPQWVLFIQRWDGFFQVGVPVIYATSVIFVVSLGYLLLRRLADAKVKYISLPSDYFALYLLLGIGISGILMRHVEKVDIVQVKAAIAGWASLQPVTPVGVGLMYFVHVFLVGVLLIYFPFSKLLHAPGVFLSPARNLANSNRRVRHINPWNPDVDVHTYVEWEEEFRDKLVAAGYPLDKE
jgi:nitrate reductase gamma subunit